MNPPEHLHLLISSLDFAIRNKEIITPDSGNAFDVVYMSDPNTLSLCRRESNWQIRQEHR